MIAFTATAIVGGAIPALARDPYVLENKHPKTFEEMEQELGRLDAYVGGVQCGGQILNEGVGDTAGDPGAIARVTGVPGRDGTTISDLPSGMGVRAEEGGLLDDGYQFPDTTTGLSTRCNLKTSSLKKMVFAYDLISYQRFPEVQTPYFEDPPCRWGAEGEDTDKEHSKQTCREFHDWLNSFAYPDCYHLAGSREGGVYCRLWCMKRTCTDGWTDVCNESLSALTNGEIPDAPIPDAVRQAREEGTLEEPPMELPTPRLPNSVECEGPNCRCEMPESQGGVNTDDGDQSKDPACPVPPMGVPGNDVGMPDYSELSPEDAALWQGCRNYAADIILGGGDPSGSTITECIQGMNLPEAGLTGGIYASYYRHYDGRYERRKFEEVSNDHNENNGPVMCFGFYDEFDPRYHRTTQKDKRCLIGLDVSEYPQDQIGAIIGPSTEQEHDPNDRAESDFDINLNLWFNRMSGVLSFLNERQQQREFGNRVAPTLLDGSAQRAELTAPDAEPNRMRGFDNTGKQHTLVQWWEEWQVEMARQLSPGRMMLLLPPSAAYGYDPLDPLFVGGHVTGGDARRDPRSTPVEVQIRAREDIVGEVASYIERSPLMRIEQKDVPFVVADISPVALRSIAQAWCTEVMRRGNARDCKGAPGDVQRFMNSLLQLANDMESVRTLRVEQMNILGSMLDFESELNGALSSWVQQNKDVLREYMRKRAELLKLEDDWRETQGIYAAAAKANYPWCMRQSFTLPVYSLLDRWLPARENQGDLSGDGLPRLQSVVPGRDVIFDLSRLIYKDSTPITIPVLQPVEVTLNIDALSPPKLGQPLTAPTLPALIPTDTLRERFEAAVNVPSAEEQSYVVGEIPKIVTAPELPGDDDIENVRNLLRETQSVLTSMMRTYAEFWGTILFNRANEVDPETLGCKGWDSTLCRHVEMDMRERWRLIGSRPFFTLNEDRRVIGQGRNAPDTCLPGDEACWPLIGQDTPPAEGWVVLPPSDATADTIDDVRKAMLDATMPEPLGSVPREQILPYDARANDLVPAYNAPPDTDILPPSSEDSSIAP